MPSETTDGIPYPDNGDDYALVADLGALAEGVQDALGLRANTYFGTSTERVAATPDVPIGTLWVDTTGDQALYARRGTSWSRIWPDLPQRTRYVGSYDTEMGIPAIVFRRLLDGHQYVNTVRQIIPVEDPDDPKDTGTFQFFNMKDGSVQSYWNFGTKGEMNWTPARSGTTHWKPWAQETGVLSIGAGTYTADTNTTRGVSFTSGLFTSPPVVTIAPLTGLPRSTHSSILNVTTSGFDIVFQRVSTTGSFSFHWTATQMRDTEDGI